MKVYISNGAVINTELDIGVLERRTKEISDT